jgi:predicted DNA-binding ribbon-helix-helix protein
MKDKTSITVSNDFYAKLKEFCNKKGLKIGWLVETTLLNYIKKQEEI